jgi:hypothetical protein
MVKKPPSGGCFSGIDPSPESTLSLGLQADLVANNGGHDLSLDLQKQE